MDLAAGDLGVAVRREYAALRAADGAAVEGEVTTIDPDAAAVNGVYGAAREDERAFLRHVHADCVIFIRIGHSRLVHDRAAHGAVLDPEGVVRDLDDARILAGDAAGDRAPVEVERDDLVRDNRLSDGEVGEQLDGVAALGRAHGLIKRFVFSIADTRDVRRLRAQLWSLFFLVLRRGRDRLLLLLCAALVDGRYGGVVGLDGIALLVLLHGRGLDHGVINRLYGVVAALEGVGDGARGPSRRRHHQRQQQRPQQPRPCVCSFHVTSNVSASDSLRPTASRRRRRTRGTWVPRAGRTLATALPPSSRIRSKGRCLVCLLLNRIYPRTISYRHA